MKVFIGLSSYQKCCVMPTIACHRVKSSLCNLLQRIRTQLRQVDRVLITSSTFQRCYRATVTSCYNYVFIPKEVETSSMCRWMPNIPIINPTVNHSEYFNGTALWFKTASSQITVSSIDVGLLAARAHDARVLELGKCYEHGQGKLSFDETKNIGGIDVPLVILGIPRFISILSLSVTDGCFLFVNWWPKVLGLCCGSDILKSNACSTLVI